MEVDPDGVVGEAVLAVAAGDRPAQHAADGAVDVAHPELETHRVTALQGGGGQLESRWSRTSSRWCCCERLWWSSRAGAGS